ncbi:PTS sugar transporter subunit IIB [Marinilongibacter aquaticus]|uniref:PTS sugar transporter subunit IIB n=1 Tax=Marinilongibacter aquaticus TaxID=2975157 RepID=UPI0021BD6753|nr:PTS sugar transporter subunit IIB [Marinilongibacter aquaticus]UBM58008.1 PTS sugar transporter subunit IIB [Marinilongibacter aquaticus]
MIKLTRIDDRLVHGQVAFTWVPALGIDCLLVANDSIAKDDFQKMTLGLAKPANAKLVIRGIDEAIQFLNDGRNDEFKTLILVNSVNDAYALALAVDEIKSINFGGIRTRDGARLISKAVAIDGNDELMIKDLASRGVEMEVRQVPTDKKQLIQGLMESK